MCGLDVTFVKLGVNAEAIVTDASTFKELPLARTSVMPSAGFSGGAAGIWPHADNILVTNSQMTSLHPSICAWMQAGQKVRWNVKVSRQPPCIDNPIL